MLVLGDVRDDPAVRKFHDAVGVALRKVAVVRYDENELSRGELFQGIEDLLTRVRVERTRRLVRHDDLRVLDERTRDGNALLLTARKLVGLALGKARQVHLLQDRADRLRRCFFALKLKSKRDIRAHGEVVKHVILLEDKADKGIAVGVKVTARKVARAFALDDKLAAVVAVKTAHNIEKRGFTATRFTQNKDHSRFGEGDVHAIKCANLLARFGTVDLT